MALADPGRDPAGAAPAGDSGLLALRKITKAFPGVLANDRVSLEIRSGEVHALLGENGAGKTTLVNILYGIHQPDDGEILVEGRPVRIRSPRDAIALGVGMVPQHFLLIRRHTVAENVLLGLPGQRFFNPAGAIEKTIREMGARYGLAVDPRARIRELSASEQQRVEIVKALVRGARILVLDEPTSVLTPQEARGLFQVMRRMKQQGQAVVFISHKLDEVVDIADRITVLRRGRVVGTVPASGTDKRSLARMMVGRDVEFRLRRETVPQGEEALRMERVSAEGDRGAAALKGISLTVHSGEIVGVAGVAGNGQRELVEVLTGLRRPTGGRIEALGSEITGLSAGAIDQAGVAHIPEDRIHMGIVGGMTVSENLVLKHYRRPPFSNGPLLDPKAIGEFARRTIAEYDIATPGPSAPARQLSGGNIQKLILGRELSGRPGLIVAAHPTSGLDVSATEQVHRRLLLRRRDGAAILLVSEDLDEILALSDRIAVIYSGEILGIVPAEEADRERIGLLMMGQRP